MTHVDLNLDAGVELVFATAFFISIAAIAAWAANEMLKDRRNKR